jgi:hypothetical protein
VINDARHPSNIIDVTSYRGADSDSDHFMVKIKYRPKTAIMTKSTGGRTSGLIQRNSKMYQFIRTSKVPLKTTLTECL